MKEPDRRTNVNSGSITAQMRENTMSGFEPRLRRAGHPDGGGGAMPSWSNVDNATAQRHL